MTILAGAAGISKTTLALGPWCRHHHRWPLASTKKGNVLVWSSEDVADDTMVPQLSHPAST